MDRLEQLVSKLQDNIQRLDSTMSSVSTRLEEHAKQDAENFQRISNKLDGLAECMGQMREDLAEGRGSKSTLSWLVATAIAVAGIVITAVLGCR